MLILLSFLLYSRAKKSITLLIFVKIGTNVDLNIQILWLHLFELLVISFHDFKTLKSKSIVNFQWFVMKSAIGSGLDDGISKSCNDQNWKSMKFIIDFDFKVVKPWKLIASSSNKCDHWIWDVQNYLCTKIHKDQKWDRFF